MKSWRGWMLCVLALLLAAMVAAACGSSGSSSSNKAVDDDDDSSPIDDDASPDDDDNDDLSPDDDDDASPPPLDVFVPIDHGSFAMGSPAGELGRRSDEAQHTVTLTHDFEIGAIETTQTKFLGAMGFNPSWYPGWVGHNLKLPVERVSWYDALAYANKLSAVDGYAECFTLSNIVCADSTAGDAVKYCRNNGGIASATVALNAATIYDCAGYRLPTEAEWEYAARAGSTAAFYNGGITQTTCVPDPNLTKIAWYCGNAGIQTHEPGGKTPNAWGLYDMLGNVAEWTWDWYQQDYGGNATDPTGPSTGYFKAVRGAAIRFDGALRTRLASRAVYTPDFRTQYAGFRLVRTLSASVAEPADPAVAPAPAPAAPPQPTKAYPSQLPFTFTRPTAGTPLTDEEVAAFTQKITGFWKSSNYLHWQLWTVHGMGQGNGYPDYGLHYSDLSLTKSGASDDPLLTFAHNGTDDNLTISTSKVFNNVMAYYLLTGDAAIGGLVKKLSKGYVALERCMLWTEQDPETALIARAPFPEDNDFIEEGRRGHVDYSGVRHVQYDWNAQQIENLVNPDYGDMWVRTERSQDDVPHIYRTVPMLMRVAQDGADADVRDAAGDALNTLQAFAKDIVDSGYYIRAKDHEGNQRVPTDDNNMVADLASFVNYTWLVPGAECDPRLASALIGYGNHVDQNCGNGIGPVYEGIATNSHYYNYEIVRFFHIAALYNALMVGENDMAKELMKGLAKRADEMLHSDPNRNKIDVWWADAADILVASAATGLPLTAEETQLIATEYGKAADWYAAWQYWDPWAPSVPNGSVPQTPDSNNGSGPVTGWENMLFFLEYCYSPLRNPATAPLIDCDIVRDPSKWGTGS